MKKAMVLLFVLMLALSLALTGCAPAPAAPAAPAKTAGTAVDGNEVAIEKAAMKLLSDVKEGGYQLIGTEDLKAAVDAKEDMIIIDTMPADFFAKGHIPGALNAELPKEGVEKVTADQRAAFEALLGEDKTKKIVVYCGFVGCRRSDAGARIAVELGYENVYRHPGGIIAWQDAGYESEK